MRQAMTVGTKKLPISIKDIFLHNNGDALSSELVLILKEKVVGKVSSWFTDVATESRTVKIVQNASENGKDHTFFTEVYDTSRKEKKNNVIETKVIDIYALLRAQYTELSFKLRDIDMFLVKNDGRTKHYEIPVRVKFSHKDSNPDFLEYYIIPMDTSTSRASSTTKNANHHHSYTVDANGNGYTAYAYSPDNPRIKHRHVIKNGIVQDAQSDCYPNCEDMYGSPGVGPHIHNIVPNIERHTAIQNGSVLDSGVVYTTAAGRIWSGDVYHHSSRKEAFADKKMTRPLTMVHVTNTKVKDFRKAELADSIIMNVSLEELENKFKARRSYFSEAYVSRTLENECSLMFSMDYKALFESKATMRDFKDPNSEVSLGVDVKRVRILRKKIKTNSRVTESRATGYDEEVILEFKVTPGAAMTSTSPSVTIEEIQGFSFSEPGMKTFNIVDRSMADMNEGIYQYGIEFVYVDDSVDKMLSLRRQIDADLDELKIFFENSKNHINRETNRFSDKYVDAYANNEALSRAIGNYVSALGLFKNSPDAGSTARFLMASTSVHTGSPEGILSFYNALKKLSSKINKIVIEKTTGLKGMISPNTKDVNISHRSHKETSMRYYFDNSYNASVPKNVGYDFLSYERAANRKPETRKITPQSLLERGRRETKKYFKAGIRNNDAFLSLFPDQDDTEIPTRGGVLDGEVTYFTPSFVLYGDNKVFDNLDQDLSKPPGAKYNDFIVNIVDRKFNGFSLPSSGMPTHRKVNNIVSNRNVLLLSRDVDVKGQSVGSCGNLAESLRAFKIIRRDSGAERNFDSFEEEKANLDEAPENKNLFLFSVLATENFNMLGASISRFDVSNTSAPKTSLLRLPNQLKSLAYSNTNSPLVRSPRIIEKSQPLKDSDNFGFVYMNYKNIVSVEYLDTLPIDSDGNTLPRGETWRKLTAETLSLTNSGKLLCRIKKADLDEFNIRTANILDLPIYNEYFVVDSGRQKVLISDNDATDNRLVVRNMHRRNIINESVVPCDVIHLRGR